MKRWGTRIAMMAVVLLTISGLSAQRVQYSPYFRDFSMPAFQVAAKAGDYYWVEKEKSISRTQTRQSFEVYDSRMNAVQRLYNINLPEGLIKQYLVGNSAYFDQLTLTRAGHQSMLWLKRYSADGHESFTDRIVDSLPFSDDTKSFLLLRSPGGIRNQLLAFQQTPSGKLRLHVLLFDRDWNIIRHHTMEHQNIVQPFIQDDVIGFPAEAFDNFPAKLADNGEWMMGTPSRTSMNFILYHGCEDGSFSFHEVRISPEFRMEDVSVTLDSHNSGGGIAVLSTYKNTSLKKLQVAHYSMLEGRFDFDSAYVFNTLVGDLRNTTIVRETLSGLPQGGYLFCKEYGREKNLADDPAEPALASDSLPVDLSGELSLSGRTGSSLLLSDSKNTHKPVARGDLSMFYFPSGYGDSAWTAQIREPQITEMNWPALSYLLLPQSDNFLFVYNSCAGFSNHATSASVDHQGHTSENAMVFWKFNRQLDFQHGRRITQKEVAVPYADRPGFAIIQL